MRSDQRGIVAALAATALLVTAAPAAASAGNGQAGADREARGQIKWTACEEDKTAECGVLRVPIDWRRPRGATFDLALARRKAADPAKRIGALVINPGGPGGSGVDAALGAAEYFTPEIMAKFDVVGFDPRGVARSHAVRCSTDLLAKAPSPELTSQADFDRLVAYNAELGKDCRAHTGPLFDHVDTGAVIQDIDAVRKALGERRISYYGVSYGTLIGQQYAERFPKNFRALVIDSNMDHSLQTRAFLMTETVTGEANFNEFVKWCARDTRCAVRDPGASQVWKELLARADRGELPDPEDPTRKLTAWDLTSAIFGAFYGPDWKGIADAMAALRDGTPLPAAKKLLATRGAGVAKGAASRAGAAETAEYPLAVFCEDWRFRVRDYRETARLWEQAKRLAPHMRMSPIAWGVGSGCLGFGAPVNNPQRRLSVRGAAPILMTNALYDPATGYNWATNAARQLGRAATLVTYEGWGHGVYGRGECSTAVTDRYLVDLTVPKRGTRCPAVPPVFEPGALRAGGPGVAPLPW